MTKDTYLIWDVEARGVDIPKAGARVMAFTEQDAIDIVRGLLPNREYRVIVVVENWKPQVQTEALARAMEKGCQNDTK